MSNLIERSIQGLFDPVNGNLRGVVNALGNEQMLPTFPLTARRNLIGACSNMPALTTGNGNGQNNTYSQVFSSWGSFNAVKLVFYNNSGSIVTVDNTTVSAGATIYPGGVNDISNSTGNWQTPLGSISVPAGSTKQFGIYTTPWIPLQSIPRAAGELDGGKYPLLFTRHFVQTGNTTSPYTFIPTTYVSPWTQMYNASNNLGLSLQTAVTYGGNGVTTIGNVTAPLPCVTGNPLTCVSVGAIFAYDALHTTICAVSDSTGAGNADGATTILSSTIQAAAALASNGKNINFINASVSGATMANIAANAATVIANFAPDLLVLHSWTVNSPYTTQAQWDAQWNLIMAQAMAQIQAGGQVLMHTPWPNSGITTGEYVFQQVIRQRVINSGLPYVDMNVFNNGSGGWANPAYTVDGTHCTPLGYTAVSQVEYQAMQYAVQ